MVIESGAFSVNTAPLIASWASHRVADNEKRRLIFLFSTIDLPKLSGQDRGSLVAPSSGVLHAPLLTSASGISLSVGSGGTLNAPQLTSFTSGVLTLGSGQTLNAPAFTDIDNSRFILSGGAQLSVGATSYSATGLPTTTTLFSADGAGTVLDLSSITNLNDRWNDNSGNISIHTIMANAGGVIDLSGLQSVDAPLRQEDRLTFSAANTGSIVLGEMTALTGGRFRVVTDDNPQSRISAGTIEIDASAILEIAGRLEGSIANSGSLHLALAPNQLVINGDFTQTAGGNTRVVVGGLVAGTSHDRFMVSGSTSLAGKLSVALVNGFAPAFDYRFSILTFASRTGIFETLVGFDLGGGLTLDTDYQGTQLDLVVVPA